MRARNPCTYASASRTTVDVDCSLLTKSSCRPVAIAAALRILRSIAMAFKSIARKLRRHGAQVTERLARDVGSNQGTGLNSSRQSETTKESTTDESPPAKITDTKNPTASQEPEPAGDQAPSLPTSQRLWNMAYDRFDSDSDSTKLDQAYTKILTTVLAIEAAADADADSSPEDPAKRQRYMRKLVQKRPSKG
jgi:hypothetical protein